MRRTRKGLEKELGWMKSSVVKNRTVWEGVMSIVKVSVLVSRPVLWCITCWLYFCVAGVGDEKVWMQAPQEYYVGLFYVCFPLNLLVYAWNDYDDLQVDLHNPRKGNYLQGTKGIPNRVLEKVLVFAVLVNVAFLSYFSFSIGIPMANLALWFVSLCMFNYLYNSGPRLRRGPAPLDFVGPLGYLLVFPLASWINNVPHVPFPTIFFHVCIIIRSQLWGQVIDYNCDLDAGRQTTAIVLGITHARTLLVGLVAAEFFVALTCFDFFISAFSFICLLASLFERVLYPAKQPTLKQLIFSSLFMFPGALLLLWGVWNQPKFSGILGADYS